MDKKRTFFAVILATILALVIVLTFLKPTTKTTPIKLEPNEIKIQEEKIETPIVKDDAIQQKQETPKKVTETKPQKIVKPAPKRVETLSPKQIETPVIKPLQIKEEVTTNQPEEKVDNGIIKETSSNDIVITREFKSQTPAKYSFEGYGVQKAPVK